MSQDNIKLVKTGQTSKSDRLVCFQHIYWIFFLFSAVPKMAWLFELYEILVDIWELWWYAKKSVCTSATAVYADIFPTITSI